MKNYWIIFLFLGGCHQGEIYRYAEGKIYGTYYHISYAGTDDLQAELQEQMELVNASLSMFNSRSVISAINRNESDSTDRLFRRMFQMALKINEVTAGAFDITVGPLVNAWGFGFKRTAFPDSLRIDSILRFVGMNKLELKDNRLLKQFPEITLDASSIAKGLGVDLAAEYLESQGIENYMVEIGGEVRVKVISSKKRPWRIGIDRPEDDVTAADQQLQMILGLTSGALATSGNYRNFYIHEGKKYAHTLNPKTGYPVQTEVLSASVYAASCMEADAYATAFMVLGLQQAKEIIETQPQLEGCFIYLENGKIKTWISAPLQEKIIQEGR